MSEKQRVESAKCHPKVGVILSLSKDDALYPCHGSAGSPLDDLTMTDNVVTMSLSSRMVTGFV